MQVAKLNPYWYTPQCEQEEAKPTRFRLKPIEQSLFFEINEECQSRVTSNGDVIVVPSPSAAQQILEAGVVGWERLMNGKKPVKFDEEKKRTLIPYSVQVELVNEIFTASSLSGEQVKN